MYVFVASRAFILRAAGLAETVSLIVFANSHAKYKSTRCMVGADRLMEYSAWAKWVEIGNQYVCEPARVFVVFG